MVNSLRYQNHSHIYGINVAAPLHNQKGETLGAISITQQDVSKAQETYWLVIYLSRVLDNLYLDANQPHYEEKVKKIIDLLPIGITYLNDNNGDIHYNEKFSVLTELSQGKEPSKQRTRQFLVSTTLSKETRPKIEGLFTFKDIIGNCQSLDDAKEIGKRVAETSVPVLIYGENGTGKEMFAQAIHENSPRREKPFIAINCGAIPAELVESELFGYEEGSFTGALKGGKIGKIEAANEGTLFLDEIESMPVQDQIKLLRVLSTGKVQRIGSTKEISVDTRIISATKKDLLEESDKGFFREDLYFRISTFIIELPPLRERDEDIMILAEEFATKFSRKYNMGYNVEMEPDFKEALKNYSWRGNVRELEHAMERAIILLDKDTKLKVEHLPKRIKENYNKYLAQGIVGDVLYQWDKKSEQGLLAMAEVMIIEHVLKITGGNVSAAAEKLGITRRTIYNKLQEFPELRTVR
ncbi:MAG: sigma-54-dependent Fis family transcriptional regulator [Desulfitobacterium sp.]|nr:sigma-54-dependent Fis family transcriptional regulator [Desulfitobacterium sp.]